MKKSIEKFLEFNGKSVSFLNVDGQWWVAIKPICEALNVDYEAQRKRINQDEILSLLPSIQTVVAANGDMRKMLCLPEKYIYGWLFSIRSESEGLAEFKKECYEVLFNYFHGGIRSEKKTLMLKNKAEMESLKRSLDTKLAEDPQHQRYRFLDSQNKMLGKEISQEEKALANEQLNIFRHQIL